MLRLIISVPGERGVPKFHLFTYWKTAPSLLSLRAIVKGTNFFPILLKSYEFKWFIYFILKSNNRLKDSHCSAIFTSHQEPSNLIFYDFCWSQQTLQVKDEQQTLLPRVTWFSIFRFMEVGYFRHLLKQKHKWGRVGFHLPEKSHPSFYASLLKTESSVHPVSL